MANEAFSGICSVKFWSLLKNTDSQSNNGLSAQRQSKVDYTREEHSFQPAGRGVKERCRRRRAEGEAGIEKTDERDRTECESDRQRLPSHERDYVCHRIHRYVELCEKITA